MVNSNMLVNQCLSGCVCLYQSKHAIVCMCQCLSWLAFTHVYTHIYKGIYIHIYMHMCISVSVSSFELVCVVYSTSNGVYSFMWVHVF